MSVCVNRARYFAAHGPWGRMVARQPRAGAPAPVQRVAYSRGPGRRSHADLGRDARSHRREKQRAHAELQLLTADIQPVYSSPNLPATVPERRESLRGFVYGPFRAEDF